MYDMKRPYFEIFDDDGQSILQVNFDSEGLVGAIFTKFPLSERMVMADLESFPDRHPELWIVISMRIRHELAKIEAQKKAEEQHVSEAI